MQRLWNMIMEDEENGGDPGTPGGGAPPAASPAAAGAPAAQGGEAGGPPKGAPAEQLVELKINGKVEKLPLEKVIARAQQVTNITRREQELARQRDDLADKTNRLNKLLEEAENGRGAAGDEDKISKLEAQIKTLTASEQARRDEVVLEKALKPAREKFPGLDEDAVLDIYLAKVKAGEIADGAEGMMAAAEEYHTKAEATRKTDLEKLLADDNNPLVRAHTEKTIRLYREGKIKLAAGSGGGPGAGSGAGAPAKEDETISEIAARLRGG